MEVYTVEEISEMLKVSSVVIRKHLRSGDLQGYKIGKHWRIPKESLDKFLKESSNQQ